MVGNPLLWAEIVFGVVALLRGHAHSWWTEPRPTAEELLAERFARAIPTSGSTGSGLDALRQSMRLTSEQ
jgi:hypothetical protein